MEQLDKLMSEIKKMNSKANISNLTTGVVLLLLLAGASLWYFTSGNSNNSIEKTNDVVNLTNNKEDKNLQPDSALGTGGPIVEPGTSLKPVVKRLPNTSSR